MSNTPFRDRARQISLHVTHETMATLCDGAYSASWWRKLIRDGPWGDRDQLRPPTDDKLDGIAKLFETTPRHVAQMIAVDWYWIKVGIGFSDRVKRLIPLIDSLSDRDATLIETLLLRLCRVIRLPAPFQDKAREIENIYCGYEDPYEAMAQGCGRAYSATWWRRLLRDGPWEGEQGRLLPPTFDKLDAIAEMFETTPERVAQMIVVDWYGVQAGITFSARVEGLIPMIDLLSDEDVRRVESLLRRLTEAE